MHKFSQLITLFPIECVHRNRNVFEGVNENDGIKLFNSLVLVVHKMLHNDDNSLYDQHNNHVHKSSDGQADVCV